MATNKLRIYLACPYTSDDKDPTAKEILESWRFDCANKAATALMLNGFVVFSPVSHSHPISAVMTQIPHFSRHNTHEFWLDQDGEFLKHFADILVVLTLKGWDRSKGVMWEILKAKELGIPIIYLSEEDVKSLIEGTDYVPNVWR